MVVSFGSFYACSENAVSVLAFVFFSFFFLRGFDGGYMCVDCIRLILTDSTRFLGTYYERTGSESRASLPAGGLAHNTHLFITRISACGLQAQDMLRQQTNGHAQSSRQLHQIFNLFSFPVLLVPPRLYLSLRGRVLGRQNANLVDCIVSKETRLPRSLYKSHLKTAFLCRAKGGNGRRGHALSDAWGGLRGSGIYGTRGCR